MRFRDKVICIACVLACLGNFGQSPLYGVETNPPAPNVQNKLAVGDAYFAAEDYDKAIAAYADSASSSDQQVAMEACAKLVKALAARQSDADGLKWPVSQWVRSYLLELAIIAASLLLVWWLALCWSQHIYSNPWKCSWKLRMHTAWTQELPTDVFLEEFKIATGEIAELGDSLSGTPFANRLHNPAFNRDFLLMTLSLENVLREEQLIIQGVDVGWLHKLCLRAIEHLSCVLHIHVVKLDVVYAYASLRVGSRVKVTWRVPDFGDQPPANVREAARQLAFKVFSKGWTRT